MENFCAEIWEEDPVPERVRDCKVCGLYKHGSRMVWGEGNPDAPMMIVLDNPGLREDKEGRAFVCGTRETLQQAANEAGLSKDDLYVTYILKRRPTRAYEKPKTRELCMGHLEHQLKTKQPSLLFCLGNVVVQSLFCDPSFDVKSLRGHWHDIHGIPTAVSYHPLAVRRRPNLYSVFMEDWHLLANRYTK